MIARRSSGSYRQAWFLAARDIARAPSTRDFLTPPQRELAAEASFETLFVGVVNDGLADPLRECPVVSWNDFHTGPDDVPWTLRGRASRESQVIEGILGDEVLSASPRWGTFAVALGGVVTASLARAVANCHPAEVHDVSPPLERSFFEARDAWSTAFYVLALRRLAFALSSARGHGLASPLLTRAAVQASEARRALGERRARLVLWGEPDPNDPRRIRSLAPFIDSLMPL